MPDGKGVAWYAASDCVYVGGFRNGKRYGEGVMRWGNQDCYEGYWENDDMSGTGKFTKADSSSYSGTWKNGVPHGRGTMIHSSGKKYEGDWANGNMEGEGKFFFDGGHIYEGSWKAGDMSDAIKVSRLQDGTKRAGAVLPSVIEETSRRSSQGLKNRTSLFKITDFEHSYQVYPTNFKDYLVFSTILFFCGLGMYLICKQ